MLKSTKKLLFNNIYLILGILLGLYFSSFISDTLEPLCSQESPLKLSRPNEIKNRSVPSPSPTKKTTQTLKKTKPIRPRYYSTELGIREKLFVGVFTSEDKVNSQALHVNKTLAHLVDKIKFFITAQYKTKTKFDLAGLVGFTDTRTKYRPFQVFKYIGDNFAQDYDFYFLTNDYTYVNGYALRDLVKKLSVGWDVYFGTTVQESSFCNLGESKLLI